MKVKPLGDRVLVKMVEMETKTAGGIHIPQTAQEKTQEGVVLAVGDDEAIKVKPKDRVIYDKYAGTTIKVGRRGAADRQDVRHPGGHPGLVRRSGREGARPADALFFFAFRRTTPSSPPAPPRSCPRTCRQGGSDSRKRAP